MSAELNNKSRLILYFRGWMCGAGRGLINERDEQYQDFKDGHSDGRKAKQAAYESACQKFGEKLSIIREHHTEPQPHE
jgi:hypothetical protein